MPHGGGDHHFSRINANYEQAAKRHRIIN
jgi:hypothetical protein